MSELFIDKTTFNDDISNWDVSNVTDMSICLNLQAHLIKTLVLGM